MEARAADLRAPLHVDGVEQFADLEVVARFERESRLLADLAQHDVVVFAARGHPVEHDVLDARHRLIERRLGIVGGGLQLLHPAREHLCPRDQGGLLVFGGGGDRLAEDVLLGPDRLEFGDRGATGDIRGDGGVDVPDRGAAQFLRRAHRIRVIT